VDAVFHGGGLAREVERRAVAERDDGSIKGGELEEAALIAVAELFRNGVHAAAAAAHDIRGTQRLAAFLELPAGRVRSDGMKGEPHGFRQAVGLLAEASES
jgi:hypothetical protein